MEITYKKKISLWHNLSEKNCKKLRKKKLNDSKNFYKLLFKFGYKFTKNNLKKLKFIKIFKEDLDHN